MLSEDEEEDGTETLADALEYLTEQISIVQAIPEGMQLTNFPNHCDGPSCWCRPRIVADAVEMRVHHKDLLNGEFDC